MYDSRRSHYKIRPSWLISVHTGAGAAYGTAKSGIGIAGVGTFRPDLIMKVCIQELTSTTSLLIHIPSVTHTSCYGRNYSSLLPRHSRPDCGRLRATTTTALQSLQVR